MKSRILIIVGTVIIASVGILVGASYQIGIYDHGKYYTVFGYGSPLAELGTGNPVLTKDNCERYAYWLTEHQKNDVSVYDENSRYPPWGNQIFPLVDYCMGTGNLIKITMDDYIKWEFQLENEH